MEPAPNFAPNAFVGTADSYVRYRPPYPAPLLADLRQRTGSTQTGRLLDLGTGPGRLALPLAEHFSDVWAVDPEPEMLAAARQRDPGGRVRWLPGLAETLEAPAGHFRLATIGEAFHRMDQTRVAAQLRRWLEPGGAVAILGNFSILAGREDWQRATIAVVDQWVPRPPGPPRRAAGPERHAAVLDAAGFHEVATHSFWEERHWSIEEIIGYLHSTSVCSRAVLGPRAAAFAADLRGTLLALNPCGAFRENLQWGYTFGRQP